MRKKREHRGKPAIFILLILGLLLLAPLTATAAVTSITPSTWNIVGLDSNTPLAGPSRFPVGAMVCSNSGGSVPVTLTWDSANPYVNLRTGSLNPITLNFPVGGGCLDAFFEVEVTQNALAFDTTRKYHITAGSLSTPTPRELYVERLVSQGRNAVTNMEFGTSLLSMQSVVAGGSMDLVVGNTYFIKMHSYTATQGYEQLENFVNFPNTVFRILSVETTYSADTSPYESSPNSKLYGDGCLWENDPNSPNYRSCLGDGKVGGTMVATYQVEIIGGGGGTESLNSLIHDFSGSSFHYNADYSTSARFANIIDPTLLTISKSFAPSTIENDGISTLTFILTNPNFGAAGNVTFIDTFPTSPGAMTVASPLTASTNCGSGTLQDDTGGVLAAGDPGIKLVNGTVPASGSCIVTVKVTSPGPVTGTWTYNNASNRDDFKVGATNVCKVDDSNLATCKATSTLTVDSNYSPAPTPPSSCTTRDSIATWTMPLAPTQGSGGPPPPYSYMNPVLTSAPLSAYLGTGTQSIVAAPAGGGGTNAWQVSGVGAWAETTAGYPNLGASPYYEFKVDTSKFGNARIDFKYYLNGNWAAAANNHIYVYSSIDGVNFTNVIDTANLSKTTWYTMSVNASATGSAFTWFRVNFVGAKTTGTTPVTILDDVSITGCGVRDPATITKTFLTEPVALNGTSTLRFTITNPNTNGPLSGISFADILPFGTEVAPTPNASTTCGGAPTWAPAAAATSLTFGSPDSNPPTGATIPAAPASCTAQVDIKATTAGLHNNVSGFVNSVEGGRNTTAAGSAGAILTAISQPTIAKTFGPNPILEGQTSTLTFTITNTDITYGLTNVSFTDTFPGTMKVASVPASTTCTGGVLQDNLGGALAVDDVGIKLISASIPAGGSCTVSVAVKTAAAGTFANTSGTVTATAGGLSLTGNTAASTLTVNPATPKIDLSKQISTSAAGPWYNYIAVSAGTNVYYRFRVYNGGDVPLYTVGITETVGSITPSCTWPEPLAVGATADCVSAAVVAVAGSHTNTAFAYAKYPSGGSTYNSVVDSATYETSSLSIVKSVTETYYAAVGDVLHYSYSVTNSGASVLTGPITVADNKSTDETCPALTTIGDLDNFFDAGEAITCAATYTIIAADVTAKSVTNTASATAAGSGVSSGTDSKTVYLTSDLTAVKTDDVSGSVALGSSFHWSITVANSPSGGSSASFANTEQIVTDDLPASGAAYVLGTVVKSGVSGNINCILAANTVTCTASGAVSIPPGLQGTISLINGSPAVTGAGTSFTTQLSPGSVILINGTPYKILSVTDNTNMTLETNYGGATEGGVSVPASFTVPITVTPSVGGSLVNPRSGGICRVDSSTLVPEMLENNNDCSNTVSVIAPNITVLKMVATYWDPINDFTSPKAIPGSLMTYTIMVTNSGPGAVDNNTTVITDAIPANTEMFVGDFDGAGPILGPVSFIDGASCNAGTAASGLSYSFAGLSNTGDNLLFSKSGGATYDDPSDIPSGEFDSAVTHLRTALSGIFNGTLASGGSNTSFCLRFRVRVK